MVLLGIYVAPYSPLDLLFGGSGGWRVRPQEVVLPFISDDPVRKQN